MVIRCLALRRCVVPPVGAWNQHHVPRVELLLRASSVCFGQLPDLRPVTFNKIL